MSFESPKTEKKIPSSFSSPEFAGPNAHEMSVMSNDSTMDSIATNVSSSITESRIIKSVNTHDSGFGDSAVEDSSTMSKKLVARTEHLITVYNQPGQPDITLMTRIENKEKSKLKSVEEDIDIKQADEEVITIVKTTKLTTKVEKVKRKKRKNSKKLENGVDSFNKTPSQESNVESVDDSTQNQSESLIYQVDINKSTEELVYQTMNKKSDEIETSETKPSAEPVLDLNSTVLDCEEILSNYSANNANNPGSPRHDSAEKEAEQLVPTVTNAALSPTPQTTQETKKKGFFKRFRSRDKESNGKRKLDPKADAPASPTKQFKAASKHYNLEKYVVLSTDEKERILYMKKECVDLISEKLSVLIEEKNDLVLNEMVSRSLDLLRHDRIESFDKLAQELEREYNIANAGIFDANQIQSVFNTQMRKLIVDEKILLTFELDKSRRPHEEFIEFGLAKEQSGANLNLISQNLINEIKENELLEQANQNEMDLQVKEKCPTPPSTPQNELGSGDGLRELKQSTVVLPADLNKEILTKVNEATVNETSVQTPRKSKKPKRKSTLSSCFTCAGVLKLSDDESRPQQQKEKKTVVVSKPNEQEVPVGNSAANVIVQTTLITHDLDKKPQENNDQSNEEKFITLDTDDAISQKNCSDQSEKENLNGENVQEEDKDSNKNEIEQEENFKIENVQQEEKDLIKNESQTEEKEEIQREDLVEEKIGETVAEHEEEKKIEVEVKKEEIVSEVPAKKSKNKKKKKKNKKKIEKNSLDQQVPNGEDENEKNDETKETSTQEEEETEIKIEENKSPIDEIQIEIKNEQTEIQADSKEEEIIEQKQEEVEEANCEIDTNIHVVETLRIITERVIQESQPIEEHQIEIKQEIEIGKELPVEIGNVADLYKPAAVQQNDPVVLPDPREKIISLAVLSESQPETSAEPVVANEAESEEDGSKISCFSCRGKKAAKKSKGPKKPIVKTPAPTIESLPLSKPIESRPVDVSLFVGLDSTDKKLDTQSQLSLDKKQNPKVKDNESESAGIPNITPSLIGSTSIEQPQSIEQENDVTIEREKDIVVEVIYESKQEDKTELADQTEDVKIENIENLIVSEPVGQTHDINNQTIENKSIENLSVIEPVIKTEPIEIEVTIKDEQVNLDSEKPKLSDDPVVLPDPSDRPIVEIIDATPIVESPQSIEQTPKISKKNSFACCGGKKSKSKKSKKSTKVELPLFNILAPKQKTIAKLEEKPEIKEKVLDEPSDVEIIESHDLPHVEKIPPKDWNKGLDRTQSTELIRREPEVSDLKITDNLGEQLTTVTIDIPSNVEMNEITVTKTENVKISELDVDSKPAQTDEKLVQANQTENLISEVKEQVDATKKDEDLTVKTSLTIDSPGAIIRIDREPDHATIPDRTGERVLEVVVDQNGTQQEQAIETETSKTAKKKTKNKKKKKTTRIDLPLVNILVPKQEIKEPKHTEVKSETKNIFVEQNVAKVVNLGNDLDKPIQLIEKETKVDITIPTEVEIKKIDVDLKLDTVEQVEHAPEINIAISKFDDQEQKNDDKVSVVEQNIEEMPAERVEEKTENDSSEPEQNNEEQKEENLEQVKEIEEKKEATVEEEENKVDISHSIVDILVPDIKKLDHEPDIVVLPEVDLSARVKEIQQIQQTPMEQAETKPVESKKSKKKKNRTSKIDLPLINIFNVKENKNVPAKTETNVYVDMPVVDLGLKSKESTSCFACKSKKSRKSKKILETPTAEKQIPKIVEPEKTDLNKNIEENEVDKAIDILDQNIVQAEASNVTNAINETEQNDEINVVPLIVSGIIQSLETNENEKNDETKETSTQEEEETEIKIEENKSPIDEIQIEIKNEQTEIQADSKEEEIIEQKQEEVEEANCEIDTNIHVVETLRIITERVIQESQPIEEHQIEIKQEIEIAKELPVEIGNVADLYKPAAVQQNDPVVLPDPREKVISLGVLSESQPETSAEPVVANEAESEEDGSKISCFSCRGKKAAKKSKGPKHPIVKSELSKPEPVVTITNLTPQIKSVNLDLFRGLDKPSSLSEMEKVIDFNDLSVVPTTTIRENQVEEVVQEVPQNVEIVHEEIQEVPQNVEIVHEEIQEVPQNVEIVHEEIQEVPKIIEIELPSDLASAVDLPPTSPTREEIIQVKSEIEQIIEPAPVSENQIPSIRIDDTYVFVDSPPVDLSTPPKKPPRGHLDTTVVDESYALTDQDVKMNVKEALIKVNSPDEASKSDEIKTKKDKRPKTSIIDLPLIDILVPKESKKSKSENKSKNFDKPSKELEIEPKGTSIELNQPEVELFIENADSFKNKYETINLSNDEKKLLKAKRNEICEYLKQRSGYKLEQLVERTSQTTSKKELKAKEKLADKLYKRSIKLMTKTRVKPMSFSELGKKLEKVVSPKTGAADIQKCVDQIKIELQNDSLFLCLREKTSEQNKVEKKEQNVELGVVVESEVKNEQPQDELQTESRKDSINSEILRRCPNLSWREANERARILFYKGQIPSIHYNEKRDSFHVSRLINSNGNEKMSEVPVTDDDVKKLLNSCGLYWNGESIGLIDKSDEIFKNAQQEAFDILNSIQVSESIQINENHCETVEQSKINYIY